MKRKLARFNSKADVVVEPYPPRHAREGCLETLSPRLASDAVWSMWWVPHVPCLRKATEKGQLAITGGHS